MTMLRSNDSLLIEHRLRETEIGEMVGYDSLSRIIGRDVLECRHLIDTAKRTLIGESIYFECVPGEGYRRIDQSDACKQGSHFTRKVRRTSRRGLRHMRHIKYKELPPELQKQHDTTSLQLAVTALFSSGSAAKRLEGVNPSQQKVDVSQVTKLFSS